MVGLCVHSSVAVAAIVSVAASEASLCGTGRVSDKWPSAAVTLPFSYGRCDKLLSGDQHGT